MSAVIVRGAFGDRCAVRAAEASNAAFDRAMKLGYSRLQALQFSRDAKREASEWESPENTALRVVIPKRGTFAGNPGGRA